MSDFAGGASGFPMTFSGGKFTGNVSYQTDTKEQSWHFDKSRENKHKDNEGVVPPHQTCTILLQVTGIQTEAPSSKCAGGAGTKH